MFKVQLLFFLKDCSVQLQLMYTPLFSRTEQEKNPIGVTNERVISSSENNRISVTKEGSKFIEKKLQKRIHRSDLQN